MADGQSPHSLFDGSISWMGICEQPCNFISPVSLMAVSFEESSPLRLNVHKTEAKTNQLLAKKTTRT